MKRFGMKWLAVAALCLAPAAFADETAITHSEGTPAIGAETNRWYLSLGAGLGSYGGSTGLGMAAGVLTPIAEGSPLFVGGDLGLLFLGNSSTATAASIAKKSMGVQPMVTALMRFDLTEARNIHPYLGLSVGPTIFSETVTVTAGTGSREETATKLLFTMMFRPGVFLDLTRSLALNLEAKLGTISRDFIFLPTASLVFSI